MIQKTVGRRVISLILAKIFVALIHPKDLERENDSKETNETLAEYLLQQRSRTKPDLEAIL